MHHSGDTVSAPVDLSVSKLHLVIVYSNMRHSDKPGMGSVTAPERAQGTVDVAKILFVMEFVDQITVITRLINASSPMV